MRIIAGEKRGIRLQTMDGEDTRPTLERVKEGMFSSIQFILPGAVVLDLYAGSGQLGLEALSRGAGHCTFIDNSHEAVEIIKGNAKAAGLYEKTKVACMGVKQFLATTRQRYDVVFLDPPYRKGIFPELLHEVARVCSPGAAVLCETEPGVEFPEVLGPLTLKKQYRYGTVMVTRYTMAEED